MKKAILIVLMILLLGIFLFTGWQVLDTLLEYREGKQTYAELDRFVSIPEATKPADKTTTETTLPTEATESEMVISWPEVDFDALWEVNEDVVGWIYIPETEVNYPIVQGVDNDQYLYRLINGKYNSSGSIFLDADNWPDFSEKNSVIYGHNMKNGTMFAGITGYKSQGFYDTHPIALLLTPEKNYIVHIFSGYVTDAWGDSWDTGFSEDSFRKWLNKRIQKSYFTSNTVPTTEDRILTFSTCTYETEDGRFVVHGVLEEYVPKTAAD